MKHRLLSMLGLARKARRLALGFDAAREAARSGQAALLAAASDVSDKTWKNLRYEAGSAGVPAVRLLAGMEELGRACGKKAGVFAVTDEGFAKAILGMTDVVKREKEEHAL